MTSRASLATLAVAALLSCLPAHAAEQTVLGSTFLLKDGGPPSKRKITLKAKEAASDNPITFQWMKNGAPVTSPNAVVSSTSYAYDSTLTLVNPNTTDSGNYYVVVANAINTVTSTVAAVDVFVNPIVITQQPTCGFTLSPSFQQIRASAETGTWTIALTMPDGTMCLVAAGQAFETVDEQLPAKGQRV